MTTLQKPRSERRNRSRAWLRLVVSQPTEPAPQSAHHEAASSLAVSAEYHTHGIPLSTLPLKFWTPPPAYTAHPSGFSDRPDVD